MAHESKSPLYGKVAFGANTVLGIGSFSFGGGSFDLLDDTELGDDWEDLSPGLRRGGTVEFSGKFKGDDTQGQDLLFLAYYNQTEITTLRFWVDDSSYYTPNSTTAAGGGLPAEVPVSHILITEEPTISMDLNNLMSINFRGRIVGAMRRI